MAANENYVVIGDWKGTVRFYERDGDLDGEVSLGVLIRPKTFIDITWTISLCATKALKQVSLNNNKNNKKPS